MSFIYVTDESLKETLLSKNCKLINEINNIKKTWVFEYNPSLFNINEEKEINKKCFVSDTLTMFF